MTLGNLLPALVIAFVAVAMVTRFLPVDPDNHTRPEAKPVGDHPSAGGFHAVRPLADLPPDALDRMQRVGLRAARTRPMDEGRFLTRSMVMGFPDITHVWVEDDTLQVAAHLVYGKSDMGANRRRVLDWLAQVEG
ncbi:MAG: DUF1499 domain-containing protein [Shimia sp.]